MKFVPFTVVLIVLVAGTIIEGMITDRWGQAKSELLSEFTRRLTADVPMEVGDWKATIDKVDAEEFAASECDGYISRTYTNRLGQRVNVYVVSGSARHVTIHTPDWCYVGAGYNMLDEPQQYTMEGVPDMKTPPEFLTTIFRKEDPLESSHIRIFWGFSDNGVWQGPRMPKPTFAGKSAMYKIYMITELSKTDAGDIQSNPTIEFARQFLPQLNKALFRESETNPSAEPAKVAQAP